MSDLERRLAEVIWNASRADEGTISATGANIVARALLPIVEQELAEAKAECNCGYGGFHEPENPRCARNAARIERGANG